MNSLKIAFLNFQNGIGITKGYWQYFTKGWKYFFPNNTKNVKDLISFINKEKLDIISLAEIEGGSWRSKSVNQVNLINKETDLHYQKFFPAHQMGKIINQGNAILSKYPILSVKSQKMPGKGESRYLVKAKIKINERTVTYFTTHLSLKKKYNSKQVEFISNEVKKQKGLVILTGDFNVDEQALISLRKKLKLNKIEAAGTFPSWKPNHNLDHVFFSKEFRIRKKYIFKNVKISDHIPISVEMSLK